VTWRQRAHAACVDVLAIAQCVGNGRIEQQRATRLDVGPSSKIDATERVFERLFTSSGAKTEPSEAANAWIGSIAGSRDHRANRPASPVTERVLDLGHVAARSVVVPTRIGVRVRSRSRSRSRSS